HAGVVDGHTRFPATSREQSYRSRRPQGAVDVALQTRFLWISSEKRERHRHLRGPGGPSSSG
ncbi:hypothetical protein, partial [Nonomuraea rubra]|uniref:hypothetical protein n=1 Tax=Nonomuraea rubra TaxID=46180 RepID=UPI0031F0784F